MSFECVSSLEKLVCFVHFFDPLLLLLHTQYYGSSTIVLPMAQLGEWQFRNISDDLNVYFSIEAQTKRIYLLLSDSIKTLISTAHDHPDRLLKRYATVGDDIIESIAGKAVNIETICACLLAYHYAGQAKALLNFDFLVRERCIVFESAAFSFRVLLDTVD